MVKRPLVGLHTLLGLPAPFGGVRGVKTLSSWGLILPHLGPMPTLRVTSPAALSPDASSSSSSGSSPPALVSALVSEHVPTWFHVDNPGRRLEGAVMEFAVKLGPGLGPQDVTLTVDDEVWN